MATLTSESKDSAASNPWVRDALVLLGIARSAEARGRERVHLVQSALFLSLGVERLLKAILYRVNPIYVYESQDFRDSLPSEYPDLLLEGATRDKLVNASPNSNVLSMKSAAFRAKAVSPTVVQHFSTIMRMVAVRDVLCHCDTATLQTESLRVVVERDGPELVASLAMELDQVELAFVDAEMASIEDREKQSAKEELEKKIKVHSERFALLASNKEVIRAAEIASDVEMKRPYDGARMMVHCPACSSHAILFSEVDYDYDGEDHYPIGSTVVGFECFYCGLRVNDYYEIDLLGLNSPEALATWAVDCQQCSSA